MFTEIAESRKTIGDVDVVYHDGLFHLFHLVLPNHDFIAHAVSTNGFTWQRVANALFIGDPGSWDDLMLWTMHVSPDPHRPGRWRMFYTGLSRREQGRVQRVGMAESDDLYHWRKTPVNWPRPTLPPGRTKDPAPATNQNSPSEPSSCFPLEASPPFAESSPSEGRHWVSFRDPFYYRDEYQGCLLVSGRVPEGPLVRRGCVSLLHEVRPDHFEAQPCLHHPGLYDDIEVPNLIRLDGEYYLIGSIREDAKIRYWHTDELGRPWRSYHDNVLLAQGNYAGRVCRDEHGWLIWNFFSQDVNDRTVQNVMPPPKRLCRAEDGLLRITTYEAFESLLGEPVDASCLHPLKERATEPGTFCAAQENYLELRSEAGFEAFVFEDSLHCFRLRGTLELVGKGKCGLVLRMNPETHDGYYLSLDLLKGVAQLRSWETGSEGSGEHTMKFRTLQHAFWHSDTPCRADVQLIALGSYLEFSVDGRVLLSLADDTFEEGLAGVYLETAHLNLSQVELRHMHPVPQSQDYLVAG